MKVLKIMLVLLAVALVSGCQMTRSLTKEYAQDITWYAEDYCGGKAEVGMLTFSTMVVKFQCKDGRRVDVKIVDSL